MAIKALSFYAYVERAAAAPTVARARLDAARACRRARHEPQEANLCECGFCKTERVWRDRYEVYIDRFMNARRLGLAHLLVAKGQAIDDLAETGGDHAEPTH